MLNLNAKGGIAEIEIAAAAVRLGVAVLKPLTEHGRDDLAFEIGPRLLRVQCKWGGLAPGRSVITVRTGPRGLVAGRREIALRLTPPKNAQRACINLAEDYEFTGAVAQLGERVAGSHEVRGSSPLSSTSTAPRYGLVLGAHEFRERFGYYMEQAAAGEEILICRHGRPFARLSPL